MNDSVSQVAIQCPLRRDWISFRLVDEHGDGKPYAGLSYQLKDSQGQLYSDVLDGEGYTRTDHLHCGPVVLSILESYSGGDPWYAAISRREKFRIFLTALQVAAEQSPAGPRRANGNTYLAQARAVQEQARFLRAEVSDFAEVTCHLPERDDTWVPRPTAELKRNSRLAQNQPGIALSPNQHHVIEIKALRAYSPLLSRETDFCALNAYHLALMSTFVYAPFNTDKKPYASSPPPYDSIGSIGHVLQSQLGRRLKPTQFNGAGPYHLLCEEVAYSKRLEVVPYDPDRYEKETQDDWHNPEDVHFLYNTGANTQAFITHNDRVVLISVRGTQEMLADASRDADARQVPFEDGEGQAHRGFYGGFQAAKPFVERYLNAFYTGEQTLMICGHSLGGAVALLLAEWLRRKPTKPKVILYTFGAPRTSDAAFVKAAQPLTHHRIVNHNDPVPAVPLPWMDAEWKLALPGTALLFSSPTAGIALLLAGLVNLQGDPYEHHGEQWHFMPRKPGGGSEAAVLWQPGCALIEEQTCARYVGETGLDGDMPNRLALWGTHHSSDDGYARAALTNLLRWNTSVEERNGKLFSEAEIRDIYAQLLSTAQLLDSWQAHSFNEFRWELKRRGEMRFYGKSDLELRAIYADAVGQAERIRAEQSPALTQTQQRLLAQAERLVTPRSVFGEHAERADLAELVAEWRGIKDNQAAERLAANGGERLSGLGLEVSVSKNFYP
jgi:predicted lipase